MFSVKTINIIIYYMSTTGNTFHYIKIVKESLENQGNTCNLINIVKEKIDKIEINADLYGFACPTFSFREPNAMKSFLKKIKYKKNQAAFILTSMEADSGQLYYRMKKKLNKKGFTIIDYIELPAPLNYTPLLYKHPGKINSYYEKLAYEFGQRLCNSYKEVFIEKNKPEPKAESSFKDKLKVIFANNFVIKLYTGKIKININKCSKCEICKSICPDNAIIINSNGYPKIKWLKCTGCCACINNCPNNALDSKRTKGKVKYICKK
ncbi:MAG: EFR1 family ferrodoxin [Promethearchaeota archaeon]